MAKTINYIILIETKLFTHLQNYIKYKINYQKFKIV